MTKKRQQDKYFLRMARKLVWVGSTSLLGRVGGGWVEGGGCLLATRFEPQYSPKNDFPILASERVCHFEVSVRGQILTRKRKKLNHRFIGVWFKPITKVLRCINRFSGFLEKLYPGIIRYFMVYCLSRVLVYLSINSLVGQWGSY